MRLREYHLFIKNVNCWFDSRGSHQKLCYNFETRKGNIMVDLDDIGNATLFGSIPILIILIIWYLVFSVPEIDKCHDQGGVIVRIEGKDKCIEKDALKEVGQK